MDFAEQLRRFRERTRDPGFTGIILLGTEQHNISAGLLLGALSCRRVAFLTTPQTSGFPAYIAGLLGVSADDWLCPPEDHTTTVQVYRSVKLIRERWADIDDPARIAADVTGGQKPMSVGLEKAAQLLGLTTIYVQSDYGPLPDGRSGLQPGTQRLVIPENPYTVFGDLEAKEAALLYGAHDYPGAQRVFARLAKNLPGRADYAALAQLAAAYAAWDAFDAPPALQALRALLAAGVPDRLTPVRAPLTDQMSALESLANDAAQLRARRSPALGYLSQPARVLPLLGSLYANTIRREEQGRYDVAALLRYRCLELLAQQRLAGYGLLTDAPDYGQALRLCPSLREEYDRIERRLFTRGRPRGMPGDHDSAKITLFNGYMLLAALADPLVEGVDLQHIRDQSEARNRSALAHGFRPITEEEYAPFRALVEAMLERYCAIGAIDRAAWERAYRFVALPL